MEPLKAGYWQGHRGRILGYAITIFLSSAGLMALEIAAARLLAPYIGVSLYSWTAIIGVILGGLSLGNWIGGVWADREGNETSVGWTLGAGALACIAILLLLTIVAGPLQNSELGLLTMSFLFVAALFFLPAVLLGVVTPLLTTLALRLDERTGHIVGMMHALAAFGSIAGTFVTGYLLIQYFGTRSVIIGTAVMLALLAAGFLVRNWKALASLSVIAVLVTGWTSARDGFVEFCDRETNYFCIRIVDLSDEVPYGVVRGMVLDHLLHGMNHRESPDVLLSPYLHLMSEMIAQQQQQLTRPLRSYFAGGGAYTLPRAVRTRFPDSEIVISELDPIVTEVARDEVFYDSTKDRVFHADARRVLAGMPEAYFDVVVGDVYHDIAIPYHLVTREYAQLIRSRLQENGFYVLNVLDAHPDPQLVKSIVKTLATVFPNVQIWLEEWPDQPGRLTYVITAGSRTTYSGKHVAQHGLARQWQEVTERLAQTGIATNMLPVLTDDHAPIERLLTSLIFGTMGR